MNSSSLQKPAKFRVGEWVLDVGAARLTHSNGAQTRLTPKALEVLLLLLSNAGKTVSREELLNTIWKASYPSDYVVSRAIADLRLAFKESARSAKYIETVPKSGYRLIAEVSEPDEITTNTVRNKRFIYLGVLMFFSVAAIFVFGEKPSDLKFSLPVPITYQPGLEHMPRISPSADWVVYSSLKPGHQDWDIYRTLSTGGSPKPLANSNATEYGPALSPSGDEVAYTRILNGQCEVVVQSLHQSEAEVLSACTNKFNTVVDWSSNGSTIAFTAPTTQEDSKRLISLVNRQTGVVTVLSEGGTVDSTDYYPRFSPSGNQIAFLRGTPKPDHQANLFVFDLVNKKQRQVTTSSSFHAGHTWLNEATLLYVQRKSGQLISNILDLESGKVKQLPLIGVFQPDFHIEKQIVSMSKLRNDTDITLFNLSDKSVRHIAESTASEWHGELSPDGRWVTFVSTRTGSNQLWVASTKNGAVRQLTRLESSELSHPRWSRDSETIFFNVKQGEHRQLFTTNIITDDINVFKISDDSAASVSWLKSNNEFVYSCQQQKRWRLCLHDMLTNKSKVIYAKKAFDLVVDQTMDTIYFTQDKLGLWQLNRKSGSVKQVWAGLPRTLGSGWTVQNNILYYLEASSSYNSSKIKSRELKTGSTKTIYEGPISSQNTSLGISAEGSHLVFSSIRSAQDDILIYGVDGN